MIKLRRNIGKEVKAFRRRQGWTQQQLADHLGIHRPQISEWERNTVKANNITIRWLKLEGVL